MKAAGTGRHLVHACSRIVRLAAGSCSSGATIREAAPHYISFPPTTAEVVLLRVRPSSLQGQSNLMSSKLAPSMKCSLPQPRTVEKKKIKKKKLAVFPLLPSRTFPPNPTEEVPQLRKQLVKRANLLGEVTIIETLPFPSILSFPVVPHLLVFLSVGYLDLCLILFSNLLVSSEDRKLRACFIAPVPRIARQPVSPNYRSI